MNTRRMHGRGGHRVGGFSMIEVMVALVVLAVGLLGFALLQTMGLRYAQSANQRTQATNLAIDLLDQMRANRANAGSYVAASFDGADEVTGCATAKLADSLTIDDSVKRWQCQVIEVLGSGSSAEVTWKNGEVTVGIGWNDERWRDDEHAVSAATLQDVFGLSSRL